MEDGEALGALGDAVQFERIDRVSVSADFTNEPLALAQNAGEDVLATEPGGMA